MEVASSNPFSTRGFGFKNVVKALLTAHLMALLEQEEKSLCLTSKGEQKEEDLPELQGS